MNDYIDGIADLIHDPTSDAARWMGIPDFGPELAEKGGVIAFCDSCNNPQHGADMAEARRLAAVHIAEGGWPEECAVATYLVQMVGGEIVAEGYE